MRNDLHGSMIKGLSSRKSSSRELTPITADDRTPIVLSRESTPRPLSTLSIQSLLDKASQSQSRGGTPQVVRTVIHNFAH